jgi:thymidylate kinase
MGSIMSRALVVELLGPPAAGKSTLAPILAEMLSEAGYRVILAEELSAHYHPSDVSYIKELQKQALLFGLSQPIWLARLMSYQVSRPISWAHRRLAIHRFLTKIGRFRMARRCLARHCALIFGEGLMQRIIALFVSERERPTDKQIGWYLNGVPRSDLLIHIHAKADVCVERYHSRTRVTPVRLQGKGQEAIASFITHAAFAAERAAACAKAQGWAVIELDSSMSLTDTQEALRTQLEQLLIQGAIHARRDVD